MARLYESQRESIWRYVRSVIDSPWLFSQQALDVSMLALDLADDVSLFIEAAETYHRDLEAANSTIDSLMRDIRRLRDDLAAVSDDRPDYDQMTHADLQARESWLCDSAATDELMRRDNPGHPGGEEMAGTPREL